MAREILTVKIPYDPNDPSYVLYSWNTIDVSGELNAGNMYQYDAPLGIPPAPPGTAIVICEFLEFSMTNHLGIETQAVTPNIYYAYSATFWNEWEFRGPGSKGGLAPYEPVEHVLARQGRMVVYDGTTDYAGQSGVTLSRTVNFDPTMGNGCILVPTDVENSTLTVHAFFGTAERAPNDGTVLTSKWTTWSARFRYVYI